MSHMCNTRHIMANYVLGIHMNRGSALVFQKRVCTYVWGALRKTWEGGVLEMDLWKWVRFSQV